MDVRRLITIEDCHGDFPVTGIGNAWSREHYGGPFHLFAAPPDRPAISLVFVQTRDGNTGAPNPEDLGGGPTDKHLIYEGLSRVAADAVLAGATAQMLDARAGGGYMAGAGYGGHHGKPLGRDHVETDVYPLDGSVNPRTVDTSLTDRLASFDWNGNPGTGIFEFALTRSSSYAYQPKSL